MLRTAQPHCFQLHQHKGADHGLGQVGLFPIGEGDIVKHVHIGEQRTELKKHANATT